MPLLLALLIAAPASAGPVLTHQGRLLSADGSPATGPVALSIRLYDLEGDASPFWVKSFAAQSLEDGYYAVRLELSDVGQPIDPVALADGETWLGVSVGGTETTPRERLASVPSALLASSVSLPHKTAGSACEVAGSLAYQSSGNVLLLCDGALWGEIGSSTIDVSLVSGARQWSDGSFAASCEKYRRPTGGQTYAGDIGDGVYRIQPPGFSSFSAYCDMTTDTGGWTLVSNYVYNVSSQYAFSERTTSAPLLGSLDSYEVNEVGTSYWGTTSKSIMSALSPTEMRFYCKAPSSARVVHFKTTKIADFISAASTFPQVGGSHTTLPGHTAYGPASNVGQFYNLAGRANPLNDSLWGGLGQSHWILGTETYCDTGSAGGWGGAATKGLFRVWAR